MKNARKIVAAGLSAAMVATMCVAVPATAIAADTAAGAEAGESAAIELSTSNWKLVGAQFYTGNEIKPYSGTYNNKGALGKLTEGKDFTIEYKDNTELGTASATITGIGKYTGSFTTTFDIIEFYIDVTYTNADGVKTTIGTLKKADVEKLVAESTDNTTPQKYQYGSVVVYVPAKSYVTYDSLMRAVNVASWSSAVGSGTDGFSSPAVTADVNANGCFYPAQTTTSYSTEGAEKVPAIISFASCKANITTTAAAAAEAAAAMTPTEQTMLCVGALEADYTAGNIAGNRFAGGVCSFAISDYVAVKANPMTVKAAKTKLKKNTKKSQKVTIYVKKAQGKVTYTSSTKKVTLKKSGSNIIATVAKGYKGTVTIKVKAAGNNAYKPVTKTVKITVK